MHNTYNWPLWHWHIEISSICPLKCPRCSRNEMSDTLVNAQLYLSFFQDNFTKDLLADVHRISFCGNDGDPIYAKDFLEVVEFLKNAKPDLEIYIVTNGSYRSKQWWSRLANTLNEHDQIHFSLDGWDQESNQTYRVNSDWSSILEALEAMAGSAAFKAIDSIYFSFNHHNMARIESLARSFAFDQMRITRSTKFGEIYPVYRDQTGADKLQPPKKFMSQIRRYQTRLVPLSTRTAPDQSFQNAVSRYHTTHNIGSIKPLCQIGSKGLFINSQGYFFPCCWIVNRYDDQNYQSWLRPEFNIREQGLESVLNHGHWARFFSDIASQEICHQKCHGSVITMDEVSKW